VEENRVEEVKKEVERVRILQVQVREQTARDKGVKEAMDAMLKKLEIQERILQKNEKFRADQ